MHTPRHAKAMCNGSDAEVHKQPVALDQTMRRDNFIISYCFMSSAHGFQLNHLLCVNGIIFHWILSGEEVPLIKVNLIRCTKWNARGRFEIGGGSTMIHPVQSREEIHANESLINGWRIGVKL